jgi:predicted HicB family RNase H-like nuclease
MMQYKGYTARVNFDDDAGIFHGEVIDLRDVITFQGRSVERLREAFKESVDDYLDFCAARNEEPEKPFSGKLMVRIDPELHRKIHIQAQMRNKSLNSWISDVLTTAIDE